MIAVVAMTLVLAAAPQEVAAASPTEDARIAGALQAAPADRRDGAAVLAPGPNGTLVELRAGTNDLVCVADDPEKDGFEVVCHHKDLAPFFARGRQLLAQGVTGREREQARWKEIESGALAMPREPRVSHVLTGTRFDPATGTVENAFLRWVIYVPFATAESTGLPTSPAPGVPWLMFAGTPGAHIMITPPRP